MCLNPLAVASTVCLRLDNLLLTALETEKSKVKWPSGEGILPDGDSLKNPDVVQGIQSEEAHYRPPNWLL
jgi:hypothetical protein